MSSGKHGSGAPQLNAVFAGQQMNAVDKAKAKVEQFPELACRVRGSRIDVEPATPEGFSVWLSQTADVIVVGFDGWHEEFTSESEALNCFMLGLTGNCRLKVVYRGRKACSWTLESMDAGRWIEDSTTGLVFVPFWRRPRLQYHQNRTDASEQRVAPVGRAQGQD